MVKQTVLTALSWAPSAFFAAAAAGGYFFAKRSFDKKDRDGIPYKPWKRKACKFSALLAGMFLALLCLPVDGETRGQLINFLGMAATGVVALSSTTFIGNAMAGLMLGSIRSFGRGDLIETAGIRGIVTEKRLLHVEIQTESRDLVTIPNLSLVTGAVRSARGCGTVISAEISLGYDTPRLLAEKLLKEACLRANLETPFVRIESLGDYSVCYSARGMLKDIGRYFSAESELKGRMLDVLHENEVEIVSPKFINQRVHPAESKFIPEKVKTEEPSDQKIENIVFDKAQNARSLEKISAMIDVLKEDLAQTKAQAKGGEGGEELAAREKNIKARLAGLREAYERRKGKK